MIRTLMKSKIHRVKVTQTDINYNGSITIDRGLCAKADLPEHEKWISIILIQALVSPPMFFTVTKA